MLKMVVMPSGARAHPHRSSWNCPKLDQFLKEGPELIVPFVTVRAALVLKPTRAYCCA
jgi:hypothetical protein